MIIPQIKHLIQLITLHKYTETCRIIIDSVYFKGILLLLVFFLQSYGVALLDPEFVRIGTGNINTVSRKIRMDILAVRLHTVKSDLLTFIFTRHGIQRIRRKFFRIFIVRSGIRIIFQKRIHGILFIPRIGTCRNRKYVLVFRQHILLDLHLIMIQRRRQEHAEKQQQICKNDSHKQHQIIADILKDHPEAKPGKNSDLRT